MKVSQKDQVFNALREDRQPQQIMAVRFQYDGSTRHVDNVLFDGEAQQLVGFEMRKAGKFSYIIKRYSLSKIDEIRFIKPFDRRGPKTARPA